MKNNRNQFRYKILTKSEQVTIKGGYTNSNWVCTTTDESEDQKFLPSGCQ